MSQATSEQPMSQATPDQIDDFNYRPVPTTAVVGLVLGVASLLSFFAALVTIVTLIGIPVSVLAMRTIKRSRGEFSGFKLALTGTLLSASSLVGGTLYHYNSYINEVPEGFERVSFNADIAKKKFIFEDGITRINPSVRKLDGKKVFLKGYMYPMDQKHGLKAFVLVKDNQQCCFGGQPAVTDMIEVHMQEGRTAKDYRGLTAVAGVFRVAPSSGVQSNLNPVYRLEAFHFSAPARTSF